MGYTDPIADYAIGLPETYLEDNTGILRRVRAYLVPDGDLDAVLPYTQASTSNKYPGVDDGDIYAHCILRSVPRPHPTKKGFWKIIVHYGPPTTAMILQPGRGLPQLKTAQEAKRVWWGRKFISGVSPTSQSANATMDSVMTKTMFRKGKQVQVFPKPVIQIVAADFAVEERTLLNEAISWFGKTGELTYFPITDGDKAMYFGAEISRKDADASVIFVRHTFILDLDDAWAWEVQELYKRFPFDEMPSGKWEPVAMPEKGTISRGTATFTRINSYLSWLP